MFSVLGYEPLSRSMLEDNSIEEIKLEFPHLLFLLQELYHRVSSQFNIFVAKKKTRDKEVGIQWNPSMLAPLKCRHPFKYGSFSCVPIVAILYKTTCTYM